MKNGMKTSDFTYHLPEELIAQTPLERRDASRLLVLDKHSGAIRHGVFSEILQELDPGDLLVLNNSRVIPARLFGRRDSGEATIEMLLLRELPLGQQHPERSDDRPQAGGSKANRREAEALGPETGSPDLGQEALPQSSSALWEVLVRPGKKARPGTLLQFEQGLTAEVLDTLEGGTRLVRLRWEGDLYALLDRIGSMPLPPYIHEELRENERYQTVYATSRGSAAAPTAGLHFTPQLLQAARDKGLLTAEVTLHVGLGTFRPVKVEDVEQHHMHSEWCSVSEQTAALVNRTKARGSRVVAVGTTSCRTLESMHQNGLLQPGSRDTDIFIYPPYRFGVVDALITNFHLPESTLLMLVSALAGREQVLAAYREAVERRYRFFSFGDAMLIK